MYAITPRHLVLTGAGIVGVACAATSAVALNELASQCGIPDPLSWALPIALDVGAAVAALAWITEDGERRSWARGIAIGALVASLVGNGLQHAIASALLAVTLPLVLVVGACIPGMLWAVVHLSALMARPEPAPKRTAAAKSKSAPPAPAMEPVPAGDPGKRDDLTPRRIERDQSRRDVGKDWARRNWPVSGGAIADEVGVSRSEGDRIRAAIKAELEAVS